MKLDKSKRTVLAMLCLYLAAGIVAVILFNVYGSKMSRKGDAVKYTFVDDGKVAEHVEIVSVNVLGESGAKEEIQPEEEVVEEQEALQEEVQEEPQGKKFYKFVVTTQVNRLRIRREPSEDAGILNFFNKGETGYILIKGENWSYVSNGKKQGYCSNEYMNLIEISKDELPDFFPEEYKSDNEEIVDY